MPVVPRGVQRVVLWAAYVLLVLWGGFWVFFSLAEGVSDVSGGWSHLLVPFAPIVVFGGMSFVWPRVGGVLLAVAGVAGLFFFNAWFADLILSLPAIVIGVTLALMGESVRVHREGSRDGRTG